MTARFVDAFMCSRCCRAWWRRARCCGQLMVPAIVMEKKP